MDKVYFKNVDDLTLCGILIEPKEKTKKCVVLCHGITVDKDEDGIFTKLANNLTEKGFATFRFDFRGHGESEGKSEEMTVSGEKRDLDSAVEFLKDIGYEEFGLLAASFGGGAVSYFTAENQSIVKVIVFYNGSLNYDHLLNPKESWSKKYFGPDQMEKLEKEGFIFIGSRHFKIGKNLIKEMKSLKPWEQLLNLDIPMLFVHGDKDEHIPYEESVKYSEKVKKGKCVVIKGAKHGFWWEGDEELGEQADKATVDFFVENL